MTADFEWLLDRMAQARNTIDAIIDYKNRNEWFDVCISYFDDRRMSYTHYWARSVEEAVNDFRAHCDYEIYSVYLFDQKAIEEDVEEC